MNLNSKFGKDIASPTKEHQVDHIYMINFENYLKPKKHFQKDQLRQFSVPMSRNLRFFTFLESIILQSWERLRQLRLPKFLHFLKARNDDGLCKRKTGFEIYCEMASIHGFYIFVGAKTWQRILWWCVICIAVLMSVIVITMLLLLSQDNPTTRFIESMMIPISEMPFPAITICNMNRISKKSLLKKARELNMTEETLRRMEAFSLSNISNLNWTQLWDDLSPRICEQIVNCKWEGDKEICLSLLHSVTTLEMRLCCSFRKQPQLYTSHYGPAKGLSLLLDPQTEDYGFSNFASSGFEVLVHDSQTVVTEATQRIYVPSGSEAHLMIKVFGTRSTNQLASLSLEKRHCYLGNERQLFYFEVYRQSNCLAECRSERLYQICGCLPSHLPRRSDWPVCQVEHLKCLQLHGTDLVGEIIDEESGRYLCDCLPSCDFYRYEIQTDVKSKHRPVINNDYNETRGSNSSQNVLIHVYYDSPIAEQLRLDVYENWLKFIGNIGGITGLFMGCSFVSVFELIFFSCVRPTCNWLTRQQIRYRLKLRARTQDSRGQSLLENQWKWTDMAFKKRRIFDLRQVQAQQAALAARSTSTSTSVARLDHAQREVHSKFLHKRPVQYLRQANKWFRENLRNYCQTTSLHGFNYITRQDISRYERWFWIVVVLLAIITSIVLVVVSWYSNRETPTVTVIESSHFPTWNIPFPAVTICNFNKISKTKALGLLERIRLPPNITKMDVHKLFNLTLLPVDHIVSNSSLQIYDKILTLNNLTLTHLTRELSPDCIDMITRCIWKGISSRCDSLFQRIETMEGQCCSFNYFAAQNNNFPEKIAYQVPKRPYRVTGCGYPTGLSVLLNPMTSEYFGTFFSGYGFRLLIHDAYNFPDENSETKVVTSTRESFVRINPESTYATSDIRRMDLEQRNCLFGSERNLIGLRRYSFINCMFQCRVTMTLDRCGCVPSYVNNNGSIKVCGILDANCLIHSKRLFSHALANLNLSLSLVRQTRRFPCDCLPDCQSNHYVSESTMGRLDMSYSFNRITNSNQTDSILLHVFFSDLMSTRYRTDIFQNWLSALASFGGLLGLIMGFSIVTAFEFIYFLTFRPVFNYINRE